MAYKYVAYNSQKQVVKGTLDVTVESAAVEVLNRAGLRVLSLKKVRRWNVEHLLPSLFGTRSRDVILFSRQLAMLLESGTGFLTALRISRDQTASRPFKRILTRIIEDVEAGSTFSAASAKYPEAFPISYSRMIKVAEQTGNLSAVLEEVVANMERDEAAKRKIKVAMTYPAVILLLGIVTVVILVTAVLPSLTRLFDDFGAQLPWNTRLVIAATDFVSDYKFYLLGVVVLIALFAVWYARRPSGRYQLERLLLKLPLIRRVVLVTYMRNFSRVMSMLLGAGLPMIEVMTVARQSVGSEVVRHSLDKIPDKLYQGRSLSQAMKADPLFPSVLVHMVATGEGTNALDRSFGTVADHYESEFDETVAQLTSIIEPVMLALVGLIVGFLAVSVIMPIYSAYNVMG